MEIFVNMVVNTIITITNNFMKEMYRIYDTDLSSIIFFKTVSIFSKS